jgi:hypothetical protein
VKWTGQISAGELFEWLRPAAVVISVLLSTWVLASARRWRFRAVTSFAFSVATFLAPLIILPIYLIARTSKKRQTPPANSESDPLPPGPPIKFRLLLPLAYGAILFALIGTYFFRDSQSVDAHLARASQARVMNQNERAIREYRAALKVEDNPHTHKLLGIELAATAKWEEALSEFRKAEIGNEPDETLPFRIAQMLSALGRNEEAAPEYSHFLRSTLCKQPLPDDRCSIAAQYVAGKQ